MADGHEIGAFRDALIFLVMAGVIVPVFHRLRISPVIGFLLGGVAVGPHGLASFADALPALRAIAITDMDRIAPLAELGVVFLLFTIGLELSFERLKLLRKLIFGLGSAQLVLSALLLGFGGRVLGLPTEAAAILGVALALSSTAIVLPVLAERKRMASATGRASLSILILQDLAVAPMLIAMTAMASAATGSPVLSFAKAFSSGILVIALLVLVGRLLLRPLMQIVARSGSQELFLATSILVALGSGVMAAMAGHSMSLGAFLAGLLLAETEYRQEIEVTIGPFKGLLLGLFFMTAGAQLDFATFFANPATIVGITFAILLVKSGALLLVLRFFPISHAAHAEIALPLAPAGEFAFVLIASGVAANLIEPAVAATSLVAVLLSMFLIPSLHRAGFALGHRQKVRDLPKEAVAPLEKAGGKVIVVGFGRVGQVVASMLKRHNVPLLAVDVEPAVITAARKAGISALYGDASRAEFLRGIGIATARAIVATSSDPDAVERLVRVARAERPDLIIIARARDADHASRLYALGASDVVPETVEASLQLAENVLVDIGVPMGLVIASVHERRDEFRAELQKSGASPRPSRANRRTIKRDAPDPQPNAPDESTE
ncbi:KefB Kef-type K+ transport systems, membrane components [Rhabdaerophilaceae bacterium]